MTTARPLRIGTREKAAHAPEMQPETDEAARKTPPLERYTRVLEALASFGNGATASETAEALGLPRATTHRLLRAMLDAGLVAQSAPGRYGLGPRMRRLLFLGLEKEWLEALVRPVISDLADRIGETCYLGKLDGDRVLSVMMRSPSREWRGFIVQGKVFPAHAAAAAKAILAYRSPALVASVLAADRPKLTPRTKTDLAEIEADLAQVRRTGLALCLGEIEEELTGVAVPVPVPGAEIGWSLGMTGPTSRLTDTAIADIAGILHARAEVVGRIIANASGERIPEER